MGSSKPAVIEARDLTKRYGTTLGLSNLDLDVERGEVFGFLGPNGAGKTTAIRLMLDLIRPSEGRVRLFGLGVRRPELRERIGYVPGELTLDERMTGHQTLRYLGALGAGGSPRRGETCERLGLRADDLNRRVRDYSRGMKQKLGLAAAFQHDPDLLILDEPTTGLDPLVREAVFELLCEARRGGKTVFLSSHVLSEVERSCGRVGIIRDGRLLAVRRVDEIQRSATRRMVVRFVGTPPLAELRLPGIDLVEHSGHRVVLRVSGALDPLLQVLAGHAVQDLAFPEPSLEEAFVSFYRSDPEAGA